MKIVSPAPTLTEKSADITTRRIPKRSISAAAKGATNPYTRTLMATAKETCSRPQPKASSSGMIRTDDALLKPAVIANVTKVTPIANHAGCNNLFLDNYFVSSRYSDKNSRSSSLSGRERFVSTETATCVVLMRARITPL